MNRVTLDARPRCRLQAVPRHDRGERRSSERGLPDEHLVEGAAERVDIGAAVHLPGLVPLFGGHVHRRPHGGSRLRQTIGTGGGFHSELLKQPISQLIPIGLAERILPGGGEDPAEALKRLAGVGHQPSLRSIKRT